MQEHSKLIRNNHHQLTRDEERAAWEAQDWDTLVNSQLKAVWAIASKSCYMLGRMDLLDDAFAIGLMELVHITKRNFHPDRGRLVTLVMFSIGHKVIKKLMRVMDNGGVKRFARINGKVDQPTGIKVRTMERADGPVPFRDRLSGDGFGCVEVYDLLDNAGLTEQERRAVEMRIDGMFYSEIGKAMGVSKERVRQVLEKAAYKAKRAAS